MYRQRSSPSLTKNIRSKSPKNGELGTSLHALSSGAKLNDNSEEDEESSQRRKLLEQLQLLGQHLAGSIVDFLIEEVEKKILNDYASAALRGDDSQSQMSHLDDSQLDGSMADGSMADSLLGEEEDLEEEEELPAPCQDEEEEEEDSEEEDDRRRKSLGGIGMYGSGPGAGGLGGIKGKPFGGGGGGSLGKPFGKSVGGGGLGKGLYGGAGPKGTLGALNDSMSSLDEDAPNGGKKNTAPKRASRQLGGGLGKAPQRSTSPRRNTIQVNRSSTLPENISPKGMRRSTLGGRQDDDDDEEEEEDLLGGGGNNNPYLTARATKRPARRSQSSDTPGGLGSFRRNSTLPSRLGGSRSISPQPPGVDNNNRRSGSPRRVSPKLNLGIFENGGKKPVKPVSLTKKTGSNKLLSLGGLDSSSKSQDNDDSDLDKSDKMPVAPRKPGTRNGHSPPSAAGRWGTKSWGTKSCSPPPERTKRKPRSSSPGRIQAIPPPQQQNNKNDKRLSATVLCKTGAVGQARGLFESKDSRRATNRNQPAMPLVKEDSIRDLVEALSAEENKDSDEEEIEEDILLPATNPNEPPSEEEKTPPRKNFTRPALTRGRTPPKMPGKLSSTANSVAAGPPAKRGVQRNSSGIRMQRFFNKPVDNNGKRGSGSSAGSNTSLGAKKGLPARKLSNGARRGSAGEKRMGKRGSLKRQFSFGRVKGNSKSSSFGMFAKDNVTNKLSADARKQKRIFKTQNAMRKLKKATEARENGGDHMDVSDNSQNNAPTFEGLGNLIRSINIPLPCGVKHECALLFVDISGFTQLSTKLKVEELSKTINAYFQSIVEHVQAFGGDILKFAGDAVFVEWRSTRSSLLQPGPDDVNDGAYGGAALGAEKAVTTAAACAARIIDKCTDYDVFAEDGKKVATLNLHCAIGFGEVLGVHLGNSDRMEYFILGEPIQQVSVAMDMGKMGEVVASPECLKFLEGKPGGEPKVILSKSNKFLNPKLMLIKPEKKKGNHGDLADRLDDWDIHALKSLQKLMAPYVHPVVVENQLFQKGYGSNQNRSTSEAEIRDVFTVFIQPKISSAVTGKLTEDLQVLKTLHNVLVVVSTELRKFKGQLRQYIVDDKGIVLIANFGLRGSTFPQMVEKLAMPFATNVQQVLKAKLGVDCKMGATFGKAYCGVVGGVERHEYAVLGPSVNLAARLMANKANKGILVDEEVRRKASHRGFEGLAPVKAKGYKHLVPIFEPVLHHRNSWGSQGEDFVGRESEIKQVLDLTEGIIDASSSTAMVWVTAESGYGKSSLLAHTIEKVQDMCTSKSATHVILCHVCSDADSFEPLSVVGPLFLDILAFVRRDRDETKYKQPDGFDELAKLAKAGSENAPFQVLGACRDAEVPDMYIRTICHLLMAKSWPTEVDEDTRDSQITEVGRYLVTILLQSTIHLDFVALGIDDIPHADRLSWKVIELLHQYSCNFLLLMGSRPVVGADMNVDLRFWQQLNAKGEQEGNFLHIKLSALTKDDLENFVKKYSTRKKWDESVDLDPIVKEVFVHSGGVPQLAAQILERKSARYTDKKRSPKPNGARKRHPAALRASNPMDLSAAFGASFRSPSFSSLGGGSGHSGAAQVGEHMLHRMDLLSPEARTHINLGAILGPAFESADVVSVMERYRGISDRDKDRHSASVLESLAQAAESGILEEDLVGAGNSMSFCAQENFMAAQESITYKFTHDDWRKQILKVVLDSWKRDMYVLLAESLEARFDFKSRRPDREIKKLFEPFKGGKKKGKNISVASELALNIGEKMIESGKGRYSVRIYQRALDYWLKGDEIDDILIMSEEDNDATPEAPTGEDLEYVIKLNAAMGRCCMLLMDKDKSAAAFQANFDLVPDSKDLKDPAILFPTFAGQFYTLRLTRKVEHEKEVDFVYGFVEEAEAHKDPIHHLQALAMEAEILGRNGEPDKALEACVDLRKLYNASTHSAALVEAYGDDYCIQCIAMSASWHQQLSEFKKAKEVCDYVLETIPDLAVKNCFLALYPILWVLKDTPGNARYVLELCQDYLPVREKTGMDASSRMEASSRNHQMMLEDDNDELEVRRNSSNVDMDVFSPFRCLHKPLQILMDLTVGIDDSTPLEEYIGWALDTKKSEFDKSFNHYTGSVGRNADSITGEICLLLATCEEAADAKSSLMARASSIVTSSMKLTKYMPEAYKQVKGFAYDKRFQGL